MLLYLIEAGWNFEVNFDPKLNKYKLNIMHNNNILTERQEYDTVLDVCALPDSHVISIMKASKASQKDNFEKKM